jgi:hypothetical protein
MSKQHATKITSVNLPAGLHKRMKEKAKKERRSISAYMTILAEKDLEKSSN